jgi:hypothetical protein
MNRTLRRLDSVHEKLIAAVSPLASEIYNKQPAAGEWSIGEIVHHLCLVEERVTRELEAAVARPPRRPTFLRRFVPTSIVASRLVRVKAPKAVNPSQTLAKEEALANFAGIRSNLKRLCEGNGDSRLRQIVFKHPFLGEIDGVAAVSFLGYHEQRHLKQIREVLRKVKQYR